MPAVTIALLCWNQGDYVHEAIESIAQQTSQDFELVVIDNGSHDDSVSRINEALATTGLRATTIFNRANLGISAALNQALGIATGRFFIAFAADDLMHPNRIAHQTDRFAQLPSSVAVLASACDVKFGNNAPQKIWWPPNVRGQRRWRRQILTGSLIPAPSSIYRTEELVNLGGYDPRAPFEDLDTLARLVFEKGLMVEPDDTVVATYRRHDTNISNDPRAMAAGIAFTLTRVLAGRLTRIERHHARKKMLRSIYPHWDWTLAALVDGNRLRARTMARRAILQPGLTPSQRGKCIITAVSPRVAVSRVQGHEHRSPDSNLAE